jgi:hypothetical protein
LLSCLKEYVLQEQTFERIGTNGNTNLSAQVMSIDQWDSQMSGMALEDVNGRTSAETAAAITSKVAGAADPQYDDELPPFDITISFANEYGQKATIVLYAVEILDEQSGFSIDNVTSEKACSFVARRVEYMKPVDRNGSTIENAAPVIMSNRK